MAGAGRRTFQPGEVLTASNVNSYLMDQSVMRFASSAARGSAVGTAVIAEGMVSYLDDANALEFYDGASWNRFAAGSGLPIANGGTGATALGAAQDNLRTGLATVSPVSIGATGGTATINTMGLATFTNVTALAFDGVFNSAYSKYRVIITDLIFSNAADLFLRLRAAGTNSNANYYYGVVAQVVNTITGESGTGVNQFIVGVGTSSGTWGSGSFELYNPAAASRTGFQTTFSGWTGQIRMKTGAGFHDPQTSYDGFAIIPSNPVTMSGTIQVFGYND